MRHPQKSLAALDDTDYLFYTDAVVKKKDHHHHHHEHGHHHHHHHDDPPPVRHSRTVYRSLGERRDARGEVQPLLAFLKNYMELPLDGFHEKKRFHKHRHRHNHHGDEDQEGGAPRAEEQEESHEFDDEADPDEEDSLDGVQHHKRGLFSRLFGPKEVKVVPIEETNAVIAKYSTKMAVKPKLNPDGTQVVEVSSVPEEEDQQDLDSLVESIIAKGANEAAQYSEVMGEELDSLRGRAHHAAHKAMRVMEEAAADLDEYAQQQLSTKSGWSIGRSIKSKTK
jgi:hypothetical protein